MYSFRNDSLPFNKEYVILYAQFEELVCEKLILC